MLKQLKSQLIAITLVAGLLLTPILAGSTSFSQALGGNNTPGLMCNGSGGNTTGC